MHEQIKFFFLKPNSEIHRDRLYWKHAFMKIMYIMPLFIYAPTVHSMIQVKVFSFQEGQGSKLKLFMEHLHLFGSGSSKMHRVGPLHVGKVCGYLGVINLCHVLTIRTGLLYTANEEFFYRRLDPFHVSEWI